VIVPDSSVEVIAALRSDGRIFFAEMTEGPSSLGRPAIPGTGAVAQWIALPPVPGTPRDPEPLPSDMAPDAHEDNIP